MGKKGEGIVAFSYNVSGATSDPSVFVNPLSALTPGIFRKLMQPAKTVQPEDAPNAETDEEEAQELESPEPAIESEAEIR